MQETKFDIWSPVDNKSLLSRLFWIMGTLVSLVLLIVSLCVENVVLSVADVFYTKPNSDTQYQIELNEYKPYRTFDWISINQNGEKVFQIEYGNGALGIPWRRIVGNK